MKGSSTVIPLADRSVVLRETSVKPWVFAVAASSPSMTGNWSGTFRRPHSSAVATSTPTIRLDHFAFQAPVFVHVK